MDKAISAIALLLAFVAALLWWNDQWPFCDDFCRQTRLESKNRPASATQVVPRPAAGGSASCPAVTDAVLLTGTRTCKPGDRNYRWRGRNDYCLPQPSSTSSQLCHNQRTGHLAWFTPGS